MSARNDPLAKRDPREVVVTRVFDADRARVFDAWTTAEHLKHWFAPAGFTVNFCTVDFRIGGAWRLGMISATGREVWARGVFQEIVAPSRIVFTDIVLNEAGASRFEVLTTVTFAAEGRKTRLTVHVGVAEIFDPTAAPIVARMDTGWRETVEKLARHIAGDPDET